MTAKNRKQPFLDKIKRLELDNAYLRNDIQKIREEHSKKWEPLIEKLIQINSRRDAVNFCYHIQTSFARDMIEAMVLHSEEAMWDSMCDMIAHELKRKLMTIGFSGVQQLAYENERSRYPKLNARTDTQIKPISTERYR
jgi:hypothetical protein